jgi:hypothetical protein
MPLYVLDARFLQSPHFFYMCQVALNDPPVVVKAPLYIVLSKQIFPLGCDRGRIVLFKALHQIFTPKHLHSDQNIVILL